MKKSEKSRFVQLIFERKTDNFGVIYERDFQDLKKAEQETLLDVEDPWLCGANQGVVLLDRQSKKVEVRAGEVTFFQKCLDSLSPGWQLGNIAQ